MSAQLSPAFEDPDVVLSIRQSRRARQLILQAVPPRTVEVVVPRGMPAAVVQAFVQEHRSWIDRAGAQLRASYPDAGQLPGIIELEAVGRRLRLGYRRVANGTAGMRRARDELELRGAGPDDWRPLLRRWLLAEGRRVLKPWLGREAERTGLVPRQSQIRLQKTRWGSCSAQGSISLNAALLLVPPELVRYLLVHELCHLAHLNHSRRYWQTVERFEPDYRKLDRQLAGRWQALPAWLHTLT